MLEENSIQKRLQWVFVLLGIMWCVEIVNFIFDHHLTTFGIYPREFSSLPGVLFAPLLHGSLGHLILNTVSFAVLGGAVSWDGSKKFLEVTLFVALVGGLAVWLLARGDAVHVGASGLIFGYFGYLIARAIFHKKVKDVLIALIVFLFYGGMIWGVLPLRPYVSWESHLYGLIAGGIYARGHA